MDALIKTVQEHGTATWIVVVSALMFFGSIVLAWLFIVKIPTDYLTNDQPRVRTYRSGHPIMGAILWVGKNAFGVLLAISGFIMLFIPGQGLLFIFLGITLVDFPGKKHWVRRMVGWRNTLKIINQVRCKAGEAPLESPVS